MTETVYDTLTTSEELQNYELSEIQSKGIARAINGAITGNVATKGDIELVHKDIELLRKDIENSSTKTRAWIATGFVAAVGMIKALDQVLPMLTN